MVSYLLSFGMERVIEILKGAFYKKIESKYIHKKELNMEKLLIEGGRALNGTIRVSGAKNSAVALIPATILADTPVTIGGVPNISDVKMLGDLLEKWRKVTYGQEEEMVVDPSNMVAMPLPNGKVKKLRASYYLMGAMLGRFKKLLLGFRVDVI